MADPVSKPLSYACSRSRMNESVSYNAKAKRVFNNIID